MDKISLQNKGMYGKDEPEITGITHSSQRTINFNIEKHYVRN